ncbi:chromosomal replication initiator protein DnaA [Granulimonas faecalis]|uniref:chromosomal replication initiator protein DnaA n=1 Tax=Granulimonas faecalis TaxID=2894155 RepID=UPI0035154C4D
MDQSMQSDARLLWDDATDLLAGTDAPEQLVRMMASCDPQDFSGGTLTVGAPSGFASRVLERERPRLEEALSSAAFEPVTVAFSAPSREVAAPTPAPAALTAPPSQPAPAVQAPVPRTQPRPVSTAGDPNTMTYEDYLALYGKGSPSQEPAAPSGQDAGPQPAGRAANPLVELCGEGDASLTFDTFVEADENRFALQAAKQVANGSTAYNPLFIHGSSGLGKTHLLRAIQNYIATNDPERQCVYRVASDFRDDYVAAMNGKDRSVKENLSRNYKDIDVLILDDIQHIANAQGTMTFFFETFNHLIEHGKQIVLAADVPPAEIGMDERFTSRMLQGLPVAVQSPSLEFKRVLIDTFHQRMKGGDGPEAAGDLTSDDLSLMAERAGGNIRSIRGFVQKCLFTSAALAAEGKSIEPADIVAAAAEVWPADGVLVSIDDIQQMVQSQFSVSRQDLVSNKRNKEIAQPRHVAIYLARELTDSTLQEIGRKFGGRSHATVKHSIAWVEDRMDQDRLFHDQVMRLRDRLGGS